MPLTASKRKRFILDSPAEVAEFFGVTETAVRQRWIPAGMPKIEPAKNKPGASQYRYPADRILTWLTTEGPWRKRIDPAERAARSAATSPAVDASQDAMMVAPISTPGLERYRNAKAEDAEMDVAERKKQLLRTSSVLAVWVAVFGLFQRLVERFARMSVINGREVASMLRETICEAYECGRKKLDEDAGVELGPVGPEPAGRAESGDSPDDAPAGQTDQPVGGTGDRDPDGTVRGEPVPTLPSSGQQDLVRGVGS
jgi:hypothetical protein